MLCAVLGWLGITNSSPWHFLVPARSIGARPKLWCDHNRTLRVVRAALFHSVLFSSGVCPGSEIRPGVGQLTLAKYLVSHMIPQAPPGVIPECRAGNNPWTPTDFTANPPVPPPINSKPVPLAFYCFLLLSGAMWPLSAAPWTGIASLEFVNFGPER